MSWEENQELIKNLKSQNFEQIGSNVSKCKKCGKEKIKHSLVLNCPTEQSSPQKKQCFKCQGVIIRQYVYAKKDYSRKNNWDYWTEKEENKEKYICNYCLLNLYYNEKVQYLKEVWSKKKRQIFKVYVYNKVIS